jgi:hypothetical protein
MQTFIESLKTFLEIVNWISGILIAVFAYLGLQQLKIAKDSITISSKRDAYKITADKVGAFADHIIPLINDLNEKVEKKKITFFSETEIKIEEKRIRVKTPKGEKHAKDLVSISKELSCLFNALEGFAIYFTSGVASEELAFTTVGIVYCESVKTYLPAIIISSENNKYYKHLLGLFFRWNKRISKMNLMNVLKSQKEIQQQLEKINDTSITPIGTE